MNNFQGRKADKEDILFSRTIKAGKRIYYIDVKQDKNASFYVAITESKKVAEGNEWEKPTFEKHKIFLYQEDMAAFLEAFNAVAQYVRQQSPDTPSRTTYEQDSLAEEAYRAYDYPEEEQTSLDGPLDFDI